MPLSFLFFNLGVNLLILLVVVVIETVEFHHELNRLRPYLILDELLNCIAMLLLG